MKDDKKKRFSQFRVNDRFSDLIPIYIITKSGNQ